MLFHYTDQRGLFGILRDRAIWASELGYSNDASEVMYGLGRIAGKLKDRLGTDSALRIPFLNLFPDRVTNMPYVASFSEVPDDLSQWRGYGGYCLGFNVGLNNPINKAMGVCGPVVYKPADQEALINALVDEMLIDLEPHKDGRVPIAESLDRRIVVSCVQTAIFMKHPAFEAEKEWRVMMWKEVDGVTVQGVREEASVPTPYLSVPLFGNDEKSGGLRCLEEITVGPRTHQELTTLRVQTETRRPSINANVKSSEIPYRTW